METNNFPKNLFPDFKRIYPKAFDSQDLQNELLVFYKITTFQDKFSRKLVIFLNEHLDNFFKEVFHLAKLICAIPATTMPFERSFSPLKGSTMCLPYLTILQQRILELLGENEDFYK